LIHHGHTILLPVREAIAVTIKQLLIIDDDQDILKLTQTCLEIMGGWQVLTASSGSQGLLKAQADKPDAILLDVMMPEMDGVATLKRLRDNPDTQHIPVILLTATGYSSDQPRFRELGVKGSISKPFKPLKLAEQVAQVLAEA
jgi:CheY-like chemotaxis protein